MKHVGKRLWHFKVLLMAAAFVVMVPILSYAATGNNTIQTSVNIIGSVSNPDNLSICADETIHDSAGNTVMEQDADLGAVFEKRSGGYRAKVDLISGMRYYVTDGLQSVAFVAEDAEIMLSLADGEKRETSENVLGTSETDEAQEDSKAADSGSADVKKTSNTSSDGILSLKTKQPEVGTSGKSVKYVIDSLSTAKDNISDAYVLQVEVPSGMVLKNVYCGTYNKEAKLELICKTEKDGQWHSWYEDINTLHGTHCDVKEAYIAEDDRICAFALTSDHVPEGFEMNKNDPLYYVMDVKDEAADTSAAGKAKLTAYVDGKKSTSESDSIIKIAAEEIIQTGDDNMLFIISLITFIVSIVTMISYVTIRILMFRREERAQKDVLSVVFSKEREAQTNEKMSALIQKRPG